ncbi:hypothetical protein B0H34DRAFT_737014 [Crassisporium funariophilum]|nr:hypothetical protein B0H34DRAFT_737014 [Crassisporium funariophilum]
MNFIKVSMSVSPLVLRVYKFIRSILRRGLLLSSFRFYSQLILFCLLFLNGRSFPLVWHVRVLRHLVARAIRSRLSSIMPLRPLEENSTQDPFTTLSVYNSWAGPDDCDFLFHLSNSSYAKNLDIARAQICSTVLATFMEEGGWIPLAAADYLFISEIPLFASYEIRSRVGSWDDKWIYLLSEFVTYPGRNTPSGKKMIEDGLTDPIASRKRKLPNIRPDGSVLHSVAVSVYCFKVGRRTVAPSVALSICGFGASSDPSRISGMKKEGKLRHFLEGGWRNEPGWDLPEYETQRQAGLVWCRKLTEATKAAIDILKQ